jgi:predicted alpha-1,6-mannanase (GH76 family)
VKRIAILILVLIPTFFWLAARAAETNAMADLKFDSGTNGTLDIRVAAQKSLDAFNHAFYSHHFSTGYFRHSTTNSRPADFWKFAEEIEMVVDAQEHYPSAAHQRQISRLIKGFEKKHGTIWSKNPFNDDIMWMCIASLRAYQVSGQEKYRDVARTNFDLCFARAWDTNFTGGGMFWKVDNKSKNSCVNGPAAIAACMLWKIYGDTGYSNKAGLMMDWEKSVLSNGRGKIFDNISTNGRIGRFSFTYNEGTYIGACNLLGRVEDAKMAADFTRERLCTNSPVGRILPQYNHMGDLAGFNGIFIRWMTKFMVDQHLSGEYLDWLRSNAQAAWSVRRPDNISWDQWLTPTPTDKTELESWGCSDTVVLLQVVP